MYKYKWYKNSNLSRILNNFKKQRSENSLMNIVTFLFYFRAHFELIPVALVTWSVKRHRYQVIGADERDQLIFEAILFLSFSILFFIFSANLLSRSIRLFSFNNSLVFSFSISQAPVFSISSQGANSFP